MALAHSPYVVWDAPYSIGNAFGTHTPTKHPFDLILKVWHQRQYDPKKYFKFRSLYVLNI